MPSGKIDLPIIEDNRDGTVRIQYDPTEDGVHELVLLHNGVPVEGEILNLNIRNIFLGHFLPFHNILLITAYLIFRLTIQISR